MKKFTVTLSDEEVKALETDTISIQDWIQHAIKNKARKVIDRIVEKHSDKQPKKMPEAEKLQIIKNTTLETAVERNARLEAEMK